MYVSCVLQTLNRLKTHLITDDCIPVQGEDGTDLFHNLHGRGYGDWYWDDTNEKLMHYGDKVLLHEAQPDSKEPLVTYTKFLCNVVKPLVMKQLAMKMEKYQIIEEPDQTQWKTSPPFAWKGANSISPAKQCMLLVLIGSGVTTMHDEASVQNFMRQKLKQLNAKRILKDLEYTERYFLNSPVVQDFVESEKLALSSVSKVRFAWGLNFVYNNNFSSFSNNNPECQNVITFTRNCLR